MTVFIFETILSRELNHKYNIEIGLTIVNILDKMYTHFYMVSTLLLLGGILGVFGKFQWLYCDHFNTNSGEFFKLFCDFLFDVQGTSKTKFDIDKYDYKGDPVAISCVYNEK